MFRASVLEHGRLWEEGADGRTVSTVSPGDVLPAHLFERLWAFDERRERQGEPRLFDWGYRGCAKARSTVGVITCPGLQVEVLPKIARALAGGDAQGTKAPDPRSNLLHMLRYAGLVETSSLDVSRLAARKAPLTDTLIRLFADEVVRELHRGMPSAYVGRERNLRAVRGRILHERHLRVNPTRPDRVFCRFDAFEVDHALHALLRATCRFLLQHGTTPGTESRLRAALGLLEDVTDVPLSRSLADGVILDRRTERFATVLDFCRLVVRGLGTEPIAGAWRSFSLLFDMNRVFEGFVAGFMRREVLSELARSGLGDVRLGTQGGGQSAHHLLESATDGKRLRLKPDILLTRPDPRTGADETVVIDTKWKLAVVGKQVDASNTDLYQVYAYAREYGAATTILLYPEVDGFVEKRFHIEPVPPVERPTQRVWLCRVPVDADLGGPDGRSTLTQALVDLITRAYAS